MRSKFDGQLSELNQKMIQMGNMIEEAISRAVQALGNQDTVLAKQIMDNDEQIDQMQKTIENICFQLLIQQQPVARDLRTITAAMKMVTDMERIGDHAADISEITICMGQKYNEKHLTHIHQMAVETVMMLNWSVEAYVGKDVEKAREVIAHDDVVDRLFDLNKKEIIELILQHPADGEEAADLLMVAKYFERIGDHATNIAEWVIYSLRTSAEEK